MIVMLSGAPFDKTSVIKTAATLLSSVASIILLISKFENAIIQLESYEHNIDGSVICVNENAIAVDHLTGG